MLNWKMSILTEAVDRIWNLLSLHALFLQLLFTVRRICMLLPCTRQCVNSKPCMEAIRLCSKVDYLRRLVHEIVYYVLNGAFSTTHSVHVKTEMCHCMSVDEYEACRWFSSARLNDLSLWSDAGNAVRLLKCLCQMSNCIETVGVVVRDSSSHWIWPVHLTELWWWLLAVSALNLLTQVDVLYMQNLRSIAEIHETGLTADNFHEVSG